MYISALEAEHVLSIFGGLGICRGGKGERMKSAVQVSARGGADPPPIGGLRVGPAREGARSKVRTINPSTHRDYFVRRRTIKVELGLHSQSKAVE